MKKRFTIIVLSILMIMMTLVSVVNAETQKIWGECTAKNQSGFVITTEDGSVTAADGTGEGSGLLGKTGWFTIEDGVITAFEDIPEYGFEIGYLAEALSNAISNSMSINIYTDKMLSIDLANNIKINGTSYRLSNSAQEVAELLNENKGFIGYTTETYIDEETNETFIEINNIVFIENKHSEYDKKQADFVDLTYKITENTQFYFLSEDGAYYQIGELPTDENNYYSFEVVSYDKYYNARAVVINTMYSKDVAFYSHVLGYYQTVTGYALKAVNKNGVQEGLFLEEEYSYSGIIDTLADFDGIIEYKINSDGFVTEITKLTITEVFAEAEIEDGKIGDFIIADTIAFEVIDEGTYWSYTKADLSDKYLYNGSAYKTSEDKTVLWIHSKSIASGTPIVDFGAKDRGDSLRVYADIDLNGYTGGGFVYIAVYKADRLAEVFTFDLTDSNSITAEDDEIRETIGYGENEASSNFTVKGFMWNENISPLMPATDITIK